MSTQDRAIREGGESEHSLEHDGGDVAAGADAAGSQALRMRAMQRRWIQRKASRADGGGGGATAAIPGGSGAQLGGDVQKRMERTLGADLSGVRVHTGGESAEAADAMGARAFTVGGDVHFNRGEFAPGSKEGDRLLAHELTHVAQGQKSGVQRKADPAHGDAEGGGEHGDHEAGGHEVSEPGDPAEHEADAMGDHAAEQLHGGGDEGGADAKGGGEHGGEGGGDHGSGDAKAGAAAGSSASKKISRKPQINAAAPDVGRKIFRATGGKTPPIPADAKKGKGKGPAPAAAAGAPAATPAKDPAEQKAEDWCGANVPKLQKFDPKTSSFSVLTMFESGLVDHKQKFKDNAKVKEALELLDKKKLEVDTTGAAEVMANVVDPLKTMNTQIPGSYQAAGALSAGMQRWKSYFVDASDGPKGYAAVQLAMKAIQTFQAEVVKNRDVAIATLISQVGGIDASDPKAMEKLEATFKGGDLWLHASGLPGAPGKLQEATLAKATKQGQIEGTLKAKQEKEKQDQDKKKQDQQHDAKGAGAGAAAPAAGAGPKEHKKEAAAVPGAANAAGAGAAAAKAPPPLPAAAQQQQHAPDAEDAKGGHGAADAGAHAGGGQHAGPDAHAPADQHGAGAHGGEKAHGPEGAHAHDPEEEKKKLEEEKHEVEREQLEVEMELACQQYVQKLAWANAGLGLLASLGGIAIPGLHIAGAIKSGAAAAEVVRAEYNAKWLSFAIKHLDPMEIQICLQTLSEKEVTFSKLKGAIEFFLAQKEDGESAVKGDMKKAHAGRHVAAEAGKGEGPEVGGEASGLALHFSEQAIEHGGGEAMGAIAGELAGILPFVSVGFGIKSALAAGDKIMNLRMELIALQDKAEDLGAQKGRKKI